MKKTSQLMPQPLTDAEYQELRNLSDEIFQGSPFAVVQAEDMNSPLVKRYEALMIKHQAYMGYVEKAMKQN